MKQLELFNTKNIDDESRLRDARNFIKYIESCRIYFEEQFSEQGTFCFIVLDQKVSFTVGFDGCRYCVSVKEEPIFASEMANYADIAKSLRLAAYKLSFAEFLTGNTMMSISSRRPLELFGGEAEFLRRGIEYFTAKKTHFKNEKTIGLTLDEAKSRLLEIWDCLDSVWALLFRRLLPRFQHPLSECYIIRLFCILTWESAINEANKALKKGKDKSGYIYIIQSLTESTNYKIGRAKDAIERIHRLEVKLPFAIDVIHVISCSNRYDAERQMHERYKDRRLNGEWFKLTEEDIRDIKAIKTI